MTIPTPDDRADHDQFDHDEPTAPSEPAVAAGQESAAPQTGHQEIDTALGDLGDLENAPLDDHHERLASAHETLHRALHPDQGDPA